VLSFLCQAIVKYDGKPQIRFVYALLNDEFGDKSIASDEYETFISLVKENKIYKNWKREAEIRKSRIKSSLEN
jgi:hypothetical protein